MTQLETLRNFVGGEYVDPVDGNFSELIDPCTGSAFARAPLSGAADVDRAVAAAATAFETWREVTPAQRQRALLNLADALERNIDRLVDAEVRNTGKPRRVTLAEELPPAIDHVRFFAGAARTLEGRSAGEYLARHTSYVRREPIGVCAQVTPWNYPLMMAIWKIAPALAAGNTVVLKPAETTPVSTLLLAEIAAEFLPAGVLNVVCGDRDTGRSLVSHPVPRLVSITGSTRAGMEVAAAAAHDLKRTHLELGGKAPVVVCEDADVAAAAAGVAFAGYFNAGQDCTAAARVLVSSAVHDDFLAALVDHARQTRTGSPDEDVFYGPLNNADQLARVAGFVDRLPDHARVETGGTRTGTAGFFYSPTVVSGVQQDDEIVQEEVFGPVVTVQRVASEEEAIRWANGVRYGLSASVWTKDHGRAMRMIRELDFGCVWVNTHIPFVKSS